MQIGGGRSLQALLSAKVALLSAIAGSIAVASCVLNDFFDYAVDAINDPSKVSTSIPFLKAPTFSAGFEASCAILSFIMPAQAECALRPVQDN